MTDRASFTKAQIRRFADVAKEKGCAVELRPNGSVVIHSHDTPLSIVPAQEQSAQEDTWADR